MMNTITVKRSTETINLDKKARPVVIKEGHEGTVHNSTSFSELKARFYAAQYHKPIINYVDGIAVQEIPEKFDTLVIQIWKLYATEQFKKDLRWATFNLNFTRVICKEPELDIVIKKGDFNSYNEIFTINATILEQKAEAELIEDNLTRISVLYTPEIMTMLGLKSKNQVLTAKFEKKMQDAILKYGKDYGIDLPTRTEYNDEYHAFKKDLIPSKGNNTFQYSMTIYEDPNDQKEFVDNSRTVVIPRSKAALTRQTEELVALHTAFVSLMYFVKSGNDAFKDLTHDVLAQEQCYNLRLQYLEDQQNLRYFESISDTSVKTYKLN